MIEVPGVTGANGESPKPLRGAAGRPLTQEQKDRMAAGRRAGAAKRAALQKDGKARVARSKQPRPRPLQVSLPGGVTAAARRKIVQLVEQVVQGVEGAGLFVAKRTPAAIPTRIDDEGKTVLAVDDGEAQRIALEHFHRFDEDKLEPWELTYLSEAITDEALRYPRLRTWLLQAVEWKDRSSLPTAVLVIALPRLHRHGVLPDEFGQLVSALRDAARSARRVDRGHRDGQDDASGGGVPNPTGDVEAVRPRPTIEAG